MSQFNLTHAHSILLAATTDLQRSAYRDPTPILAYRKGETTERLVRPSEELARGDGLNVQVITGRTDSSRATNNLAADFGNARQMTARLVRIRADVDSPASNDFRRTDSIAEIFYADLVRGDAAESAVNIADKVEKMAMENARDSWSILAWAGNDGRVGLVNGTPVDNDKLNFTDAQSYQSGDTDMRIKVDNGSIAPFEPGTRWDFYASDGTLHADEVEVIDVQFSDADGAGSVGMALTSDSSVSDLDDVADDDEIFRAGERGSGYRGGLNAWFDEPGSSDSFFGGKDRLTAANRWLNPERLRQEYSTSEQIKRDHLDLGARTLGRTIESGNTVVALANDAIADTLRRSIGEDALRTAPADFTGTHSFGELGLQYVHPALNRPVTIIGDIMAPPDRMLLITPETWIRVFWEQMGFQWFPGEIGIFYRKDGEVANGGKSMFFRAEGFQWDSGPFCVEPRKNIAILNVKA